MSKIRITPAFARNTKPPTSPRKATYFDIELTGFMLEVRSTGRKTFYQRYIDRYGRQRQVKIGGADILTVDQARQKGRAICAEVLLGLNPAQDRHQSRSIPTLTLLVRNRYLPYIKDYKRSWKTDETILRIHILPDIGGLYLDEITTDHITDMIRRMKVKGYAAATANRVVILLRYIFNLCSRWKLLPSGFENPTGGIVLANEQNRERFLTEKETKRLLASIAEDENQVAANAILMLLLTGARRSEITQARWEHVNFRQNSLLVPRSKSGRPHHIILNASAIALLKSLERVPGNRKPFIFVSPISGRPFHSLYSPWHRIRIRAGLNDLRLHDLRHSYASFLVNRGVSLYVVQGLLGHSQIRTTQRYAHLNHQTLQDAANVVSAHITKPILQLETRL